MCAGDARTQGSTGGAGAERPQTHQLRPGLLAEQKLGVLGEGGGLGCPGSPWQDCRIWALETHPQAAGFRAIRAETSTHLGQQARGMRSPGMSAGEPDWSADAESRSRPPGSKPHTVKVKLRAGPEGGREGPLEPAQPRGPGCLGSSPRWSPGRRRPAHFGSQRMRPWGHLAAPPRTLSGSRTRLGRGEGHVGTSGRQGPGHRAMGPHVQPPRSRAAC